MTVTSNTDSGTNPGLLARELRQSTLISEAYRLERLRAGGLPTATWCGRGEPTATDLPGEHHFNLARTIGNAEAIRGGIDVVAISWPPNESETLEVSQAVRQRALSSMAARGIAVDPSGDKDDLSNPDLRIWPPPRRRTKLVRLRFRCIGHRRPKAFGKPL